MLQLAFVLTEKDLKWFQRIISKRSVFLVTNHNRSNKKIMASLPNLTLTEVETSLGPFPKITPSLLLEAHKRKIMEGRTSSVDALSKSLPQLSPSSFTDEEYWLAAEQVEEVDRRNAGLAKGRISLLKKMDSGVDVTVACGDESARVFKLAHETLQCIAKLF